MSVATTRYKPTSCTDAVAAIDRSWQEALHVHLYKELPEPPVKPNWGEETEGEKRIVK